MIRASDFNDALVINQLGQEKVMSYYLGLPIDFNKMHLSPLRKDSNPSCTFYYNKRGTLLFHDFGTGIQYTPIDVVMTRFGLQYKEALSRIKQDAADIRAQDVDVSLKTEDVNYVCVALPKQDPYWKRYGISDDLLDKFGVSTLSKVFRNDRLFLKATPDNPIFAYRFPSGNIKIYRPLSKDKKKKWYGNSLMSDIGGYEQLPKQGRLVFITSSLKDLMVLHTFGFPAVCLNGEGYGIDGESKKVMTSLVKELKRRYEYVALFLDSDQDGVKFAGKLSATHKLRNVHLPVGGPKDISDFLHKHSRKHTWKMLKKLIKKQFNVKVDVPY